MQDVNEMLEKEAPAEELMPALGALALGLENVADAQREQYRGELIDARKGTISGHAAGHVVIVMNQQPEGSGGVGYQWDATADAVYANEAVLTTPAASDAT